MQKRAKPTERSQGTFIVINAKDNVAIALNDIERGTPLRLQRSCHAVNIVVKQRVPFGHKFATERIGKGQVIRKYGETIGKATKPIRIGDWIHTHNLKSILGRAPH
jgi:altronate dehydratase small subunit